MSDSRRPIAVARTTAALALAVVVCGCSSVEIVRLQPDILHLPKGTEPLAGLQVTTIGFYLFTLGLPEADLDKAINELLIKEAKKIGADRLVDLRFDVTPSHGIWFLTRIFWFRVATAWAIAVTGQPLDDPEWTEDSGLRRDRPAASRAAPPPASRPRPGSPASVPAGGDRPGEAAE